MPLLQIGERHRARRGEIARTERAAYHDAAKGAFGAPARATPWEQKAVDRQARIRGLYLAQARLLVQSNDQKDRELARAVVAFVQAMPAPDSRRLALARELRATSRTPGD